MTAVKESIGWKSKWTIRRYADEAAFRAGKSFSTSEVEGNLALTEGLTLLADLLIGAGGTTFIHANSYLGVGDTATAEAYSQTGLSAPTNKVYVHCEDTYPLKTAGSGGDTGKIVLTWRSIFTGAVGNFAWAEFTVANGSSDSAANLNRKVSAQGTKVVDQIWTLDLAVTIG